MNAMANFYTETNVAHTSDYHTKHSACKNEELILTELVQMSKVFDYIPGRCHKVFKNIKPHISAHIDIYAIVTWLNEKKEELARHLTFKEPMKQI